MHLFRAGQAVPCQWESLTQEYYPSLSMSCDFGMHKTTQIHKIRHLLGKQWF